jgi:TRAP-type C4-dicarboxylate transport system substrate-binding protein
MCRGLKDKRFLIFNKAEVMKRKMFFIFLVIALLVIPLFTAFKATPALAAQKIELGLAHIWPAMHRCSTDQFPRFIKMAEKATKGKYEIKLNQFYPGTLLGGAEVFDGVAKGVCDMGCSVPSYTIGRMPVLEALSMAGIAPPKNSDAAARTTWEYYKRFKPKEFDSVKVLYMFATGPGWLHSKTPIRRLEDVKGMSIRATGASAKAITAVGGSPAAMPQAEVYLALQKGVVNATCAPLEVLKGFKQAEVTQYSTFVPFFYTEQFYMVMNWNKWKSLPKDLQEAFDAVAEDAVTDGGQIWQYIQQEGMDFAKQKPKGHEFILLSDQEAARWIGLLKPIRDDYISRMKALGLPGEELVKEATQVMDKYNKQEYKRYVP